MENLNNLETIGLLKNLVLNDKIIKGLMNRKEEVDEKTLNEYLERVMIQKIEFIQGTLLEMMVFKDCKLNEKLKYKVMLKLKSKKEII